MSGDAPEMVELLPDGSVLDGRPDPALANPLSVQDAVARQLGGNGTGPVAARTFYSVSDPFVTVLEWVRQGTGRQLGTLPVWLRCWREDTGRGVLFTLSAPRPVDEAELTVVGMHGALSRAVLRAAASWCFSIVGLRRVVARVPIDRTDLADLLRRAGFRHEGTARDAFGDGLDASVWAMTARSCPWLPHAAAAIPTRDLGPPLSLRKH